jgi:uncharacterized protein YndB with AHSA1/START domain
MRALERLQWSVDIAAPASRVYEMLTSPPTYGQWTSAFGDGLYYEGSWQKGGQIRFLTPSGHGVISEIAENRPAERLSIRHLGYIIDGVEDTTSQAILAWAPAYENYTFTATPEGTKLTVEQDMTEEFEGMVQAWPEALGKLKALCEDGGGDASAANRFGPNSWRYAFAMAPSFVGQPTWSLHAAGIAAS